MNKWKCVDAPTGDKELDKLIGRVAECAVCGHQIEELTYEFVSISFTYCPHCGAKMIERT